MKIYCRRVDSSAESMDCHATASAVSRNDDKNADSSVQMDCHALSYAKARNDSKTSPSPSQDDTAPSPSLRDFRKEVVAIHKNNADSSGLLHCVRNDGKATDTNTTILSK
ncbi:hypothetical protein [Helicobacter sp.]|uniref:hypothetical protein n=1 Tax=Helicobacter sp. TaxID=218 RepID=UPI00388FEBB1